MSRGASHTVVVGQAAPAFQLETLEGRTCTLAEITSEGPALLAFYKVSCPTCQLTLPFLNRLNGSGVAVYAISQNSADLTSEFNTEYGIGFATLLDHGDQAYPASNAYGLTHVPTMFLLERDGTVTWSSVGFFRKDLEELGRRFGVTMFGPADRVPDFKGG